MHYIFVYLATNVGLSGLTSKIGHVTKFGVPIKCLVSLSTATNGSVFLMFRTYKLLKIYTLDISLQLLDVFVK